ncbi:uracil-DNA glycosylase [Alkalihalobacillus sp. LMS39]|uniref:uracil-DNA glycosylase n=1 Tax=Alkalihalobacillus sp. LMS39 TaxID=2924032 RepID=UPI001FB35E93|nr:uracil-DNA glycosylase [Alkalihalobacillus sp. LMS39]UOE94009.1 uracil-DNA glycosylase [Alkalihalobacillus sp. LMS39]
MKLPESWSTKISNEWNTVRFPELLNKVKQEYDSHTIYPAYDDVLNAFHYTPYEKVKAVIVGQDPYHGANQAHGLSFSVRPTEKIPPSLKNIYKELQSDVNIDTPNHGYLTSWAKQGVLLLNTVLTVREKQPHSHKRIGWHLFTDHVIETLNEREEPIVFLLWGNHASEKEALITKDHHVILKAPHPSPFSANKGFFGSRPFSRCNEWLIHWGKEPINWKVENIEV